MTIDYASSYLYRGRRVQVVRLRTTGERVRVKWYEDGLRVRYAWAAPFELDDPQPLKPPRPPEHGRKIY